MKSDTRLTKTFFLLLALALFGLVPNTVFAGSIKLRPEAAVAPADPITLGDIAELNGEDALVLRTFVVTPIAGDITGSRGWTELNMDDVRRTLSTANVNLTRLALSGGSCTVRLINTVGATPADPAPAPVEPIRADAERGTTIRAAISRTLVDFLRVPADRLRLTFDARDEAFLARSEPTRRVSITPSTTEASSRIAVRVRVFEADRLVDERSVRADAEIYRRVVILQNTVKRKDALTVSDVAESEMWIAPGGTEPVATAEDAIGAVAKSRLDAGSVLRRDALEPAVMVKKGELVSVICISGGVELTTRARAVADGRAGDLVELKTDGAKKTFTARVDGRGRAVVVVEGPTGEPRADRSQP
ncbi:MAG TPA: flagellar basal body P-ring formation chaperone FlgA [Phycisphaerales bacterium]|nr:flagellar basal body P-ring formation chaperone FlgA [Phycisphaerales bacterium]